MRHRGGVNGISCHDGIGIPAAKVSSRIQVGAVIAGYLDGTELGVTAITVELDVRKVESRSAQSALQPSISTIRRRPSTAKRRNSGMTRTITNDYRSHAPALGLSTLTIAERLDPDQAATYRPSFPPVAIVAPMPGCSCTTSERSGLDVDDGPPSFVQQINAMNCKRPFMPIGNIRLSHSMVRTQVGAT
jgi:hypothetical protein